MEPSNAGTPAVGHPSRRRTGFTLLELLTVIAIITLLIGILVPALSRAREQAKGAASRAVLKALGDGLDMFKNDNPREVRGGGGYPSSSMRDDPTEEDEQVIFGAQWLVRFLMGKKLDGYIPRRLVPRDMLGSPTQFWEQKDWYAEEPTDANPHAPLQRVGPYVPADRVKIALPKNLDGAPDSVGGGVTDVTLEQPVMLDTFGYPILYYAANTRMVLAKQAKAPIACYDDTVTDPLAPPARGIYTHADNGLFTGLSGGPGSLSFEPWDFAAIGPVGHMLASFGTWANGLPDPNDPTEMASPENRHTFPYYILNKDVFESSGQQSVLPHRRDSFILITPGSDGIYGTEDDVTNF